MLTSHAHTLYSHAFFAPRLLRARLLSTRLLRARLLRARLLRSLAHFLRAPSLCERSLGARSTQTPILCACSIRSHTSAMWYKKNLMTLLRSSAHILRSPLLCERFLGARYTALRAHNTAFYAHAPHAAIYKHVV